MAPTPPATPPPPHPVPQRPALDARGLPVGYVPKADVEVSPREAKAALALSPDDASRPLLLDCRRDDEVAFCRIAGSVHISMDRITERADELECDSRGKHRPIIIYCHHGMRSLRVTHTLRAMGYPNVRSMIGGIDLWAADIDPTIQRY